MIHLTQENKVLTIAGKIYQPKSVPHLSIYQMYNNNEANGLSVFHYTSYGFVEENPVVLHAYFDRVGRYLYCQLKNTETNKPIEISTAEKKAIEKLAKAASQDVLNNLLQHIAMSYANAEQLVNEQLSQLDNLSQHLKTQLPKYKQIANLCIEAMQQKDLWTFGSMDSRAKLLEDIVKTVEEKYKNELKQNNKKPGFYSPAKTEKIEMEPKKRQLKNKKKMSELLNPELLQQLTEVDNKVNQLSKILDAESALVTLDLLNTKFTILMQGNTSSFLETELIKVMQQINGQHTAIKLLFREKAYAGDLEAITCLRPFISRVDIIFFAELLGIGNLALCQYLLQSFDECLFYLNRCSLGLPSGRPEESITLLQHVYLFQNSLPFLEMLLQNGADPNNYGVTSQSHNGLLHLYILKQNEDFVRLLLEHGADPNPMICDMESRMLTLNPQTHYSFSALRKLKNKQPDFVFSSDSQPLHTAIITRNINIITLLLESGALVTKQPNMTQDAIGWETFALNFTGS